MASSSSRFRHSRSSNLQLLGDFDFESQPIIAAESSFSDDQSEIIYDEDVRTINDCSYHELVHLLQHTFLKQLNNAKLNKMSKKLINYFEANKINGTKLCKMTAQQFAKAVIKHCDGDKSLTKHLQRLYLKIIGYDFSQLTDADLGRTTSDLVMLPRKITRRKTIKSTISDNDCKQMVAILKNHIFANGNHQKLSKHKDPSNNPWKYQAGVLS